MNSKVACPLKAHLKNNDFDIEWQSFKSTEMYPLSLGNTKYTHPKSVIYSKCHYIYIYIIKYYLLHLLLNYPAVCVCLINNCSENYWRVITAVEAVCWVTKQVQSAFMRQYYSTGCAPGVIMEMTHSLLCSSKHTTLHPN